VSPNGATIGDRHCRRWLPRSMAVRPLGETLMAKEALLAIG